MTGPEHYRAAEHYLNGAKTATDGDEMMESTALAQVHATLAQAAATVSAAHGHLSVDEDAAWRLAIPPEAKP